MADLKTLIFDLIEIEVMTDELELLMAHPEKYVKTEWEAIKLRALFEFIDMTEKMTGGEGETSV